MTTQALANEAILEVEGVRFRYCDIQAIEGAQKLPLALKLVLENVLRNRRMSRWQPSLRSAYLRRA